MTDPDYEYRGLMALFWDFFRGDTSTWEDRFLFLEIIRRYGQPVLDVGCGTGRILLDFMSQGIDIDGIDNSPEMLDLCRQKALAQSLNPTLHLGQMESLDLPRRYQVILVPSSSFQLLTDPAQAAQAIRRFHDHLQPGGVLAMPFMRIHKDGDPLDSGWEQSGEKVRPEDGALVQRWSRVRYDPATRLEHTEDRYQVTLDGQVLAEEHHQRSPATRDYTAAEAIQLYRQAGFEDVQVISGFSKDFEPVKPDDWIVTVIGLRPRPIVSEQ
jgi:ubiquinone/menaquinone biosynthesis C-methylase UbiE